jgi:anti-sigma factor RsiW
MSADCREVRPLLDSCLSDELPAEQRSTVERHVVACPACGSEIERRRQVRRELAAVLDAGDTSALERRVLAAVGHEDRRGMRRRRLAWGAAVAASLAAAALAARLAPWWQAPPARVDDAAYQGARKAHLICALQGDYPAPLPPGEAAPRLDGYAAVGAAIEPELSRGATLLEAHVCSWPRRYAHVILQRGPHRVSVLVTPREPGETAGAGTIRAREDGGLRLAEAGTGGHTAFVVSDLQASELAGLSGRVLPSVLQALRPGGD